MAPTRWLDLSSEAMRSWLSRAEPGHKAGSKGQAFVGFTHATQTG